jgi:hypothetical protein
VTIVFRVGRYFPKHRIWLMPAQKKIQEAGGDTYITNKIVAMVSVERILCRPRNQTKMIMEGSEDRRFSFLSSRFIITGPLFQQRLRLPLFSHGDH